MISVLIIEDEIMAAKRLASMLKEIDANIQIEKTIDTVLEAVDYLSNNNPDLIFMDVRLADGLCFEIFESIQVEIPVIFITAYNDYAIKAFKVNSVDYLLKPIQKDELIAALEKFKRMKMAGVQIHKLIRDLYQEPNSYKIRFLVRNRKRFNSIETDDIAYFYSDRKLNYIVTLDGQKFIIDDSLGTLIKRLDPVYFFKISRKIIASNKSIKSMEPYFNNRIVLKLDPAPDFDVYVSRKYVKSFKKWMNL